MYNQYYTYLLSIFSIYFNNNVTFVNFDEKIYNNIINEFKF